MSNQSKDLDRITSSKEMKVGKATTSKHGPALVRFVTLLATVTLVLLLTSMTSPSAGYAALPGGHGEFIMQVKTTVYVDDSASEDGDGSIDHPVRTIQTGIDLLPKKGGTVAVYPGTYIGPIVIEKSGTVIQGLATPVFVDGYVAGFTNDEDEDDEVVITIDRELSGDLSPQSESEHVIEVRGDQIEVRDVVIDLGDFEPLNQNSALRARAEDHDFYSDIVFSEIVVRGTIMFIGQTGNSTTTFHQIVSTDPGPIGILPGGSGSVMVSEVFMANKWANVCFNSLWEFPREENPPSHLRGIIRDSRLEDGTFGLLVLGRGGQTNPDLPITVVVDAYNNVFAGNLAGVGLVAMGPPEEDTAEGLIQVRLHDNVYLDNEQDTMVRFNSFSNDAVYAKRTTIVVHDGDGVVGEEADLGPAENKNKLIVVDR